MNRCILCDTIDKNGLINGMCLQCYEKLLNAEVTDQSQDTKQKDVITENEISD